MAPRAARAAEDVDAAAGMPPDPPATEDAPSEQERQAEEGREHRRRTMRRRRSMRRQVGGGRRSAPCTPRLLAATQATGRWEIMSSPCPASPRSPRGRWIETSLRRWYADYLVTMLRSTLSETADKMVKDGYEVDVIRPPRSD